MSNCYLIPPDEFLDMPWKNGQGSTIQLISHQLPGEQRFSWRLSMATVDTDGIFSDFSGYQRMLVLLNGNGVRLKHNTGVLDELNHCLDVASFPGSGETQASLIRGPISDFNIMLDEQVCSARLTILRSEVEAISLDADHTLIYAHGCCAQLDQENHQLKGYSSTPAGHLLCIDGASDETINIAAEAAICVQISYRKAP